MLINFWYLDNFKRESIYILVITAIFTIIFIIINVLRLVGCTKTLGHFIYIYIFSATLKFVTVIEIIQGVTLNRYMNMYKIMNMISFLKRLIKFIKIGLLYKIYSLLNKFIKLIIFWR